MTDKELLELAAKAVGLNTQYSDNFGDFSIGEPYSKSEYRWNPLESDGDALRLAVDLRLDILTWRANHVVVVMPNVSDLREPKGNDKHAATRRAIVRAAAAIGAEGGV